MDGIARNMQFKEYGPITGGFKAYVALFGAEMGDIRTRPFPQFGKPLGLHWPWHVEGQRRPRCLRNALHTALAGLLPVQAPG